MDGGRHMNGPYKIGLAVLTSVAAGALASAGTPWPDKGTGIFDRSNRRQRSRRLCQGIPSESQGDHQGARRTLDRGGGRGGERPTGDCRRRRSTQTRDHLHVSEHGGAPGLAKRSGLCFRYATSVKNTPSTTPLPLRALPAICLDLRRSQDPAITSLLSLARTIFP